MKYVEIIVKLSITQGQSSQGHIPPWETKGESFPFDDSYSRASWNLSFQKRKRPCLIDDSMQSLMDMQTIPWDLGIPWDMLTLLPEFAPSTGNKIYSTKANSYIKWQGTCLLILFQPTCWCSFGCGNIAWYNITVLCCWYSFGFLFSDMLALCFARFPFNAGVVCHF